MNEESREITITPFWLAAYLLAVAVVAVGAGVLFYQHEVGGAGPLWRLLPMLWVGEILGYLVVLIAPGDRVVPPQRALTGVGFAMVARVVLAFFTATALRLGDPSAHTTTLFGQVYVARWAVALLHILLMVLYLWLVRAALETERLKAPVEKAAPRRSPRPAPADEAESRRQRLLSALMDQETPADEPPAPTPAAEPPVATPSQALAQEVEELLPPTVPVVHPTHEPSFGEVLTELARDEVLETEREEEANGAAAAAAPDTAPAAPAALDLAPLAGKPAAPADPPESAAPPLTLPLDEPEAGEGTAAFVPAAPEEILAPAAVVTAEGEAEAEALLAEQHEPETVHVTHEPSFGEVLVGLGHDEVHAAEEQPAGAAPASHALVTDLREVLTAAAGDLSVAVGEAPTLGLLVPAGQPATDLLAALQDALPVLAAALETVRAGDLETALALCSDGLLGLTAPPSSLGEGAVLAGLPGEVQLGVASLQLKQLRRQLANLGVRGAAVRPAELVPAAAALEDLPPGAQRALTTLNGLVALRGRGLVLVAAGTADPCRVAAAAEELLAACARLSQLAGLGAPERVLLTGEAGGLVVGGLPDGVLVALVAPTNAEVARLQVQLRRLQANSPGGSEG